MNGFENYFMRFICSIFDFLVGKLEQRWSSGRCSFGVLCNKKHHHVGIISQWIFHLYSSIFPGLFLDLQLDCVELKSPYLISRILISNFWKMHSTVSFEESQLSSTVTEFRASNTSKWLYFYFISFIVSAASFGFGSMVCTNYYSFLFLFYTYFLQFQSFYTCALGMSLVAFSYIVIRTVAIEGITVFVDKIYIIHFTYIISTESITVIKNFGVQLRTKHLIGDRKSVV